MNKEVCDYCIHHGPDKKVCGNMCIQHDDFEGVDLNNVNFELMAEIEDLARINEILISRYKSSAELLDKLIEWQKKDIDLIKVGELEQICNAWLTLKKEAGE